MRRREFVALLGGMAAAWPLTGRALQQATPVIGFLNSASPEPFARNVAAFRQALKEAGYIDGRNIAIEYCWAEGQNDRLPILTADLIRRRVDLIVATDSASALAAKAASMTIPVVFLIGGDPVKLDLVASFNRPNRNITGVTILFNTLVAKQLETLHETVPQARLIGFLVNPTNPNAESDTREVQTAANVLGQDLVVVKVSAEIGLETAFLTFAQQGISALVVAADPLFVNRRERLVELVGRQRLPAIYPMRDFVAAGGLMRYGTSLADGYRQVGVYAGKILKGALPADLPVLQAVKVELIINIKTATALGIAMPLPLLGRADEVIE
jgi:putative tryptophan/tyrosine transport system substrate-binding protein